MSSHEPVCVACSVPYRVKRNEVWYLGPDTLRCGDLWACPVCGHEILIGFGKPIYSYDQRFKTFVNSARADDATVVAPR